MRRLWIILLVFATSFGLEAKTKWVKKRSKFKTECRASELRRQDCELRTSGVKIGLHKDKFRFDDGKWLATQDLPISGDQVEWKRVRILQMSKRTLIEFWVWGEVEKESQLQPLHWVVLEIGQFEKPVRINQVVQRRKRLNGRALAGQMQKKAKYHYDPLEKHALSFHGGYIQWKAGKASGQF